MKVSVYSRAEAEKMIADGKFPKNTAVISFYDPKIKHIDSDYDCVDYYGHADEVFYSELDDLDIGYLTRKGLSYDVYFPEADELAEFIYSAYNNGMNIICQCEYGQSRSAGCAAAILQHFYGTGIDIFADYRRYPNQVVYHKVLDALCRFAGKSDIKIFDDFLGALRKRPPMFIRKKYITYLETLINGYLMGKRDAKIYCTRLFPLDFWFMHEFVRIKYNEESSTAGWCNIILNNCDNDEEKAFDRFFEVYDEFKQLRMTECIKYVLTENNIEYNNSMEHGYSMSTYGKEPIFRNPAAVYFVNLTNDMGWITLVETESKICIENRKIFESREKAEKCTERYFGKLSESTEIHGDNLDFDKYII